MLVPFADCINHHNIDSNYELVHTEFMQETPEERKGPELFYTNSKMDIDYYDLFSDKEQRKHD
jgi:hypothetical protein